MERLITWLKEHTIAMLSLLIVALVAILSLTYINSSLKNDVLSQEDKIGILEKELTAKQGAIDNLNAEKESMIGQIAQNAVEYDSEIADLKLQVGELNDRLSNSYQYPSYYIDYLAQNGFASPSLLIDTLSDESDLIPVKGILGGTMYWIPQNSILLNDKFVFAAFEDGHVAGFALLQYSLKGQGEVTWKIIETYMD